MQLEDLFHFLQAGVTPFHAAAEAARLLDAAGYTRLEESAYWNLEAGRGYYVTRNNSAVIAWRIPAHAIGGWRITASHSDSPAWRIKNTSVTAAGCTKLNVEGYGGMNMATWLDRPLSVAGRVLVRGADGTLAARLVDLDRDLAVIPSLAPHMDRGVNDGHRYNPQVDMQPLYGPEGCRPLPALLAEALGVAEADMVDWDLTLYVRQAPAVIGPAGEYFMAPRIDDLEWMSDDTKARAKEKLGAFHVKIGYPDTWKDYSDLEIKDDSYWANVRRSNIFDTEYMFSKLGKPVDKDEWLMAPQMVNAYYNPTTNEICFPAAILQPPFFNPDADDAVNYGAIGVVIGHEMTHGFDDQGSRYDKDGNLNNWWTEEDAARFKERTDVLVNQFNAIEVAPGVHANGSLTLGENIADQGGLLVARLAYENSLADKEQRPADIDGFNDVQRFYIGYGSVWSQNIRPEEVLRLTKLDPHSLGEWRVNATLRNIDDFYKAFDIKEGDKMYLAPENRVNVW